MGFAEELLAERNYSQYCRARQDAGECIDQGACHGAHHAATCQFDRRFADVMYECQAMGNDAPAYQEHGDGA